MTATNTLSTISSLLHNLLGLGVLAVVCGVGWVGYEQWHQGERLGEFRAKLRHTQMELQTERQRSSQLEQQVEKLDTALHLVKVDHRLAEIRVVSQHTDPATARVWTDIEFVEIAEDGREISTPKEFTLEGDKVYVDYWVVKFADHYVEQAELNRGTSICLFRGIHGEYQSPADAFRLDDVGARPPAYSRGKAMSKFEQQIWSDFWEFANNPELAQAKGIRAAHGEEPYTAVRNGMTYRLELRASGGLTIAPTGVVRRVDPNRITDLRPSTDSSAASIDVFARGAASRQAAGSGGFKLRR